MTTLMSQAAQAASLTGPTHRQPTELPEGLTAVDADRIAAAISAARTESTQIVYAHAWRAWVCVVPTAQHRADRPVD